MSDGTDTQAQDQILKALERIEGRLTALEAASNGATAPAAGGGALTGPLAAKLADAEVNAGLARILDRMDSLEAAARSLETVAERAPIMIDAAALTADYFMRQADEAGVDVFARGFQGAALLEKASRPENMALVEGVLDHGETIGFATDKLLNSPLMERENLEATLDLVTRLTEVASTPAFKALLDSGVLESSTLSTAGDATTALVEARAAKPAPLGMFGVLGKLGDADVKKAMGFTFELLKRFGSRL
ncbi:MAG: DUF1641 domain-containing protein [Myxococcota bacterium]